MSTNLIVPTQVTRRHIAVFAAVLLLGALTVATGPAAAHNPACVIPGMGNGDLPGDSPHYPATDRTASDTAFDHNPNLRDSGREESLHPDHANSIHNDAGDCSAPRYQDDGGN